MKTIQRAEIKEDTYQVIFETEKHHNHEIIKDNNGTLRWKESANVAILLTELDLNDVIRLFLALGYDKNSEIYRKLYRDMGYSLYGYWEIFYWPVNNRKHYDYKPIQLP